MLSPHIGKSDEAGYFLTIDERSVYFQMLPQPDRFAVLGRERRISSQNRPSERGKTN
jgi:hypothetical protein